MDGSHVQPVVGLYEGIACLLNLFERTNEDELNGLENKVATYPDRQERLFFWYRNRARKDYYLQG